MLVDALQSLATAGFQIRDYQYTGMGSIFFVDFILFHKLLGIHRMLSVEFSERIERRVKFNRPFGGVTIEIGSVGEFIPQLSRDLKHLVWLDYDDHLTPEHLQDASLAGTFLTPGSILLVTVDAEPPIPVEAGGNPKVWREYFVENAGLFIDPSWTDEQFSRSLLPKTIVNIVVRALQSGLAGRSNVEFAPMFNFRYADGHEMVTVGGMMVTESEQRQLISSGLVHASYTRFNLEEEAYTIRVPRLTRKERAYLDAWMPCLDDWLPDEFELRAEDVLAYRDVYRFFPAFAEILL
ncbi:MAG: hypothetical protein KJ000_13250 [Pirellulaceae bacterium]|nr:hypothetical protein [Pirellulaceae bacterium]